MHISMLRLSGQCSHHKALQDFPCEHEVGVMVCFPRVACAAVPLPPWVRAQGERKTEP